MDSQQQLNGWPFRVALEDFVALLLISKETWKNQDQSGNQQGDYVRTYGLYGVVIHLFLAIVLFLLKCSILFNVARDREED